MRKENLTSHILQKSTCLHLLGITLLVLLIGCNDPQPLAKEKTGRPQTTSSKNTTSGINTVPPLPQTPPYEKTQYYKELQAQIDEKERLILLEPDLARQLDLSEESRGLEQEAIRYSIETKELPKIFAPVSDQSDRLCQAKLLFDEGRFCDADAVLSLEALLQEQSDLTIQEAVSLSKGGQQEKEALAWEYCIKALLWETFYNRPLHKQQARQYFEDALQLSQHPRILLEYARFFYKQEQHFTAYALGKRACALCEENTTAYLPELADTLHLLFFVERRMDWNETAAETAQNALSHYRKLMQENPYIYAAKFCELLRFSGFTQYHLEQYDEAVKKHQEIVDTCRRLAANNPEEYEEKLICAMQDLSYTQYRARRSNAAKKTNNEAIFICRQGLRKNPKKYKPLLAYTFQYAASFMQKRKEKERNYIEAIAVYRELAQENPDEYLPALANILHDWGNYKKFSEHLWDKKQHYTRNLQSKSLLRKAKGAWGRFVYQKQQIIERESAKRNFEEAIEIYRKLFSNKQFRQTHAFGKTLIDFADLQNERGLFEEAQKNYEEALQIQRTLVKHRRHYKYNIGETLRKLGVLYINRGNLKKAEKLHLEALELYRELSQEEPQDYMNCYISTLLNLGEFYLEKLPNREKSIALAKKAMELLPFLDKNDSYSLEHYPKRAREILQKNGASPVEDIAASTK